MEISKVQNNVSFGYDKILNKQVITKLKKSSENSEYFKAVLDVSNFANRIENKITNLENSDKYFPMTVAQLGDALVELKGLLCDWIGAIFPELHYAKRELRHYRKEMRRLNITENDNHWLRNLVREIKMRISFQDDECIDDEFDEDIQQVRKNLNADKKDQPQKAKDGELEKMPGAKLVKKYVPTEIAQKGFAGLGGMKELKETLADDVVSLLKDPAQAKIDKEEFCIELPAGILMYGPPGCGKTTIVEHLSCEAGVPLLKVEAGTMGAPYIHETSQNIDKIFDYAEACAKGEKPVILMIDDADALFQSRGAGSKDHHVEELSSFLNRIQKATENNVLVVAATNRFDMIDDAIKGRFEMQPYVGLPDKEARMSIIKMFLEKSTKGQMLAKDEDGINTVADLLDNFSIRDIKMITKSVFKKARKEGRHDLTVEDFKDVISKNQNRKVKEDNYRSKNDRRLIGFNSDSAEKSVHSPKTLI